MGNEIFEKNPASIKNYGIWIRYQSRDTTMNSAIEHMFQDMASRHRVSAQCIQIIKAAPLDPSKCKRLSTLQYHDKKIKFVVTRKMVRPSSKRYKTLFKAHRPKSS